MLKESLHSGCNECTVEEVEGLDPGLQRGDVVGFSGGGVIELDMAASKMLPSYFVLTKTHSKVNHMLKS